MLFISYFMSLPLHSVFSSQECVKLSVSYVQRT